ncbi:uncharacterized protein CLUP02_01190 [Colletotrichum lupini]|uniref:Uncharacterized protein n=1 Tax=Colletotrichum lupini TaxID=145971 RepID=A0A9Q8SBW7_9PEZI|nr:uncharacterized protein CLUP02_01190 [Colletotrichum lupini]UQC74539.1 hypothetical protein CLUP02_01190 [Colletotrichum lupini]
MANIGAGVSNDMQHLASGIMLTLPTLDSANQLCFKPKINYSIFPLLEIRQVK